MDIINDAIGKVRNNKSVPQEAGISDDLIFGIVCYKYFYNEGRYDITDFQNSFTDGSNDGGIDLIAVNENELSKSLVLIQSKNIQRISSKDEIKDIFTKMAQTAEDFKKERVAGYNSNLRRVYREKFDDAIDDPNFAIELVLFINTDLREDYKEADSSTKCNSVISR